MSKNRFISKISTVPINNQRKRKSLFDTLERYVKTSKASVIFDTKATPEQLDRIRSKIRKGNIENFVKTIFYTIASAIILFILFKFAPV